MLGDRRGTNAVVNRALYDGDHLHLGTPDSFDGYIGILPPASSMNYSFTIAWLERIFAAANLVKSSVTRNLDACLSRDVDWTLQFPETASEAEKQKLTLETTDAFNNWWNDRNIIKEVLSEAGKQVLLDGEVFLRPVVAVSGRTESGTLGKQKNLEDAFNLIEFEVVTDDRAGVFRDRETGEEFSICLIETDKTKEIEVSFVGADGLTYLRILRDDDLKRWTTMNFTSIAKYLTTAPVQSDTAQGIDLGGRLYLHRIRRDSIIAEPARRLQASINYALTTMNKNLNIAGSRETGYGNTQKPKKLIVTKDAGGNIVSSVEEDAPLVKGAENSNFFVGIPIYSPDKTDIDGNPILVDYKQPVQFVVDPVAVDTFIKAFEVLRELFLEEVHQSHILSGNLTVSGKSKQESRADFQKSAQATRLALNAAGRYTLDIALKLGARFCGRTADFQGTRFDFNCQLSVGAIDPQELKQEAQDVKDGFSTLYIYLLKKGVEDPDAAMAQLKSADDYVLNQLDRALKIFGDGGGAVALPLLVDLLPIDDADKQRIKAAIDPAIKPNAPPLPAQ